MSVHRSGDEQERLEKIAAAQKVAQAVMDTIVLKITCDHEADWRALAYCQAMLEAWGSACTDPELYSKLLFEGRSAVTVPPSGAASEPT